MIFDIYNENSYKHINDWLQEVNRYAAEDSVKILIGNKIDKGGERVISTSEAQVSLILII
jgi:Ras-related protein Rab-1A